MDNSKINWLNIIIIDEFLNLTDIDSLKELSLASKLVREKLKHIIFKYISITMSNFYPVYNTEYKDFFIDLFYSSLNSTISAENESLRKDLKLQEVISDINHSLIDIKRAVTYFNLEDVRRAGFYLFPIIYNFSNLSVLRLESCVIPFSYFSKIGVKLPNLRKIHLCTVYLVKSLSDIILPEPFIFPNNLDCLEIYHCKVINNEILPDPYDFLFSKKFTKATHYDFKLPPISAPSLKKLHIFYNNFNDGNLNEFLTYNPTLEALTTMNFYSDILDSLNSMKYLEFRYLVRFGNCNSSLPINSVTHLKINVVNTNYYESIKKLCLLLPNLEYINFNFSYGDTFQTTVDNFIEPILSNLAKLKTLELVVSESWSSDSDVNSEDGIQNNLNSREYIDLGKFSNIDTLILTCDSSTLCNLNFKNCKALKHVKLLSNDEVNLLEFKSNFDTYKNWKFSFIEYAVIGYKL
jgi:hypothetical protein